jgi:ADP-ribose pyrophosphatase YjhB (NUDIX family)
MPFRYCPSCGSQEVRFEQEKAFRCASCGFLYFHNVATAAGALIEADDRLVFIVRAMAPAAGRLALPGGFVDPGERAEDAVRRECREEIGWYPQKMEFLASFPNRYEYRNVLYNTCDLFFIIPAPGLRAEALSLDPQETSGVRFLKPEEIDMEALAFDSTRKAVAAYLYARGIRQHSEK